MRNVPLLRRWYGTGMTPQEMARLTSKACLRMHGNVLHESYASEDVAYNGTRRPIFCSTKT